MQKASAAPSACHPGQRARLTHWAPDLGSGGESLLRPGVGVVGAREVPVREAAHPVPVHPGLLAATPKRCSPEPDDLVTERADLVDVAGHGVVREMPAHDGAEPASLLLDGPVAARHQRGLDLLELSRLAFLDRPSPDREVPVPPLRAEVREAEELERLRLAKTTLARRWAANRPNSISRVFSAFSSRPNLARRCSRSVQNRSASSRCSNPTTASSANRTMTTSPCACRVLHWWAHRSNT